MSITYSRHILSLIHYIVKKQRQRRNGIKVMFLNKWMLGLKKVEQKILRSSDKKKLSGTHFCNNPILFRKVGL